MMINKKPNLIIVALITIQLTLGVVSNAQQSLPGKYPANTTKNYVRVWETIKPVTDTNNLNLTTPVITARMTSSYYDGLGRELQTVLKKGSLITNNTNPTSSANAVDIVSGFVYDEFGRQRFNYLPYPANSNGGNSSVSDGLLKLNPFQQQEAFYNTYLAGQTGEVNGNKNWAYSQAEFENLPMNRNVEQFAPGVNWVGTQELPNPFDRHSMKTQYWFNTGLDSVRIWSVTDESIGVFGNYSSPGIYGAGLLQKTSFTDENGSQVIEFKDKEGLLILKKVQHSASVDDGTGKGHSGWVCTYYLYDQMNQLRAVIQPEGVKELATASWVLNASLLNEQCFRYEYDEKQRLINKKVPGAGEMYLVYDSKDRLVMTQDANLRIANKWMVSLYDGLNRILQTGLMLNTATIHGAANRTFAQHRAVSDVTPDYPFPVASPPSTVFWEWLTRSGYDNYSGIPSGLSATFLSTWNSHFSSTDNNNFPYPQMPVQSTALKGLLTWVQVKVLGTAAQYLGKVMIYDNKGRVIQLQSQNITGELDVVTSQYSWIGQPLIIVSKLQKAAPSAQTTVTVTRITYDELNRLVKLEKRVSNTNIKVNGTSGVMSNFKAIFQQEFDAMGMKKKKIISPTGSSEGAPLEILDHDYNIRSWLTGVNRDYVKDASINRFGFELGYDKTSAIVDNTSYADAQFNGNISGVTWKSIGDQQKRKYDFTYDKVNRLTGADFGQHSNGAFNLDAKVDFSVKGLSYDANGNILAMNQKGWAFGGSVTIDSLLYHYFDNSNKLKNVIDRKNDTATKLDDFRSSGPYMRSMSLNKTAAATDYYYDANGNMVRDLNKDIGTASADGIVYNHLNLPAEVKVRNNTGGDKGTIIYTYDAAGERLKKTIRELGKPDKVILYLGGTVYENDSLQFIPHEEGRIRNTKRFFTNGDSAYTLEYDYFLKDHLGNVRMVLTEQQDTIIYAATMELASRDLENALFSNITNTLSDIPSGYPPDGSTTNPNDFLAKLNGSNNKIGPGIVLKVMSGDSMSIGVKSYFKPNASPGGSQSAVNDILLSLATGITGAVGDIKGGAAQIGSPTGPLAGMVSLFRTDKTPDRPSKPRAYLNWILFDEQLNYVEEVSSADPVKNANVLDALLGNVKITRNGFLYIYVSNETQNWDVFFNDLTIQHYTGPLTEETHYYPFGLIQKGISTTNTNVAINKYKFGNKELDNSEFSNCSGLDLYDFGARSLDPQIGRWLQVDPVAGKFFSSTPYSYVDGNPIVRNDPNGEDWFRNDETGEIVWRNIKGKQGEQISLKGSASTWTNLGPEIIIFSGDRITYYSQSTDENGNLIINSQEFDAVSGAPLDPGHYADYNGYLKYENSTVFDFDFSIDRQKQPNQGPTPEGVYSINKSGFQEGKNESGTQKWSGLSLVNKLKAHLGGGTWPGGTDSWGDVRWQLTVEKANTFGRKYMYLHGGTKWGSRGCIDVGNNIGTLANAILTNKTGNDKVYLQVIYPHDLRIKVANGTTNHLQKVQ